MEQIPRLYLPRSEMMKRIARFKDLKGFDGGLPDSKMPGCERTLFNVIGFQPPEGIGEGGVTSPVGADAARLAAIKISEGFNLGYCRAKPGHGPEMHNHDTNETFIPMTGTWRASWEDENGKVEYVDLGPFDVVSFPPGMIRRFENVTRGDPNEEFDPHVRDRRRRPARRIHRRRHAASGRRRRLAGAGVGIQVRMTGGTSEILFNKRGAAGVVTLNRPQALNAVTHGMVLALSAQLETWADDESITRVVIAAAGNRAFSAGGDIRHLYELGVAGRQVEALQFWRDEYPLNALIKSYRKPYVALIDGIVMGGGVGVSVHGSHRVVGDRFSFAMPEVGIGFFPDVGATWFLPRLPGELGTYCALTGERFNAADGVAAGVATHYVSTSRHPDLLEGLMGAVSVDATLAAFAEPAGEGPIMARSAIIDRLFARDTVEDILAALDREADAGPDAEWAAKTAATMRTKSPLSLKIALQQMRRGKAWDFETCMRAEFHIVSRIIEGHDFYEGVRAVIVDKDNKPLWNPATLAAASEGEVARHFAPRPGDELVLP